MTDCEICGDNNWSNVDSNWLRCDSCGRLETRAPERICLVCGFPIGRYAKLTQQTCIRCKDSAIPPERLISCKTPACGNKLGKRASPSGYCRQCLREMNTWVVEDGHLWKGIALSMMTVPMGRGQLLKRLSSDFPDLSESSILNWLLRLTKNGTIERVGHGTYRIATPENSTKTIRLDPDEYSPETWGLIRVTRIRAPDD